MFRVAVVGRPIGYTGEESHSSLSESVLKDEFQKFCWLRFLDVDGDGKLSQADFCAALRQPERWPRKGSLSSSASPSAVRPCDPR